MSDSSAIGRLVASHDPTSLESHYREMAKKRNATAIRKTSESSNSESLNNNSRRIRSPQKTNDVNNPFKPSLKPIFKWKEVEGKSNNESSFHIQPTEKNDTPGFLSQLQTASPSNRILSILGYRIDISQDIDQFKQKLQKYYVESKSHNRLIGTFSELKFGLMSALLSLLGVEPNTLETLKKDALKAAINDNIQAFEQNEYNIELITIFSQTKKDKGRIKVLTTLRKQLIKQMQQYGQPDFYTKETIYDTQKNQVKKILDDLLQEQQNLMYLRDFQ
ncbi:MAG: hypothetical protein ISQ13_05070 [Candidatus Margulisbacteria bacterium]|nr:hypothetical protein [Candidatus Margulisiibacteriota bacterium]